MKPSMCVRVCVHYNCFNEIADASVVYVCVCVCIFFAGWAHSRWGRDNCKVGVSEQVRVRHRLVHFLTREQKCQFTTLQHIEHMSLSAHSAAMLNIYTHTPDNTLTFTIIILLTSTLLTSYTVSPVHSTVSWSYGLKNLWVNNFIFLID